MTDHDLPLPHPDTPGNAAEDSYWESLGRFASDNAEKQEADRVRHVLAANPADSGLLQAIERALPPAPGWEVTPAQVQAALDRVNARRRSEGSPHGLRVERGGAPSRVVSTRPRWNIGLLSGIAAALLFGAVALWPSRQTGGVDPAATVARTIRTDAGTRDSVRLPDGTRVVLAPLSALEIPADYGKSRRAVKLTGEALFDVLHDATHPFAIQTPSARIEDLGTSFTVRDDAADSVVVRVTSGSVRLSTAAGSGPATLGAGDVGVVRASQGIVEVRRGSVSAHDTAWVHGELAFRNATMDEVALEMHRWYGVRLRVVDEELERRHVTATLADEPVDRALQIIGLALGAEVERNGDTATVRLPRPLSTNR